MIRIYLMKGMKKMRKISAISMIVIAISLSFSVVGCLVIMNQGNVSDEISLETNVNLLSSDVSSKTEKSDDSMEIVSGPTYEKIKVIGDRYTYNWSFSEDDITSMPTELSIDIEDAIDIVKKGVKDLFQFEITSQTVIDVSIAVMAEEELYYIVLNNTYLEDYESIIGEYMFFCTVNAITGQLMLVENNSVEGAYDDEDELWQYDDEGNEVGFNIPSYFSNSTQLNKLKKECEDIAKSFVEQLGIYEMTELTYLKTEAYETRYPWTIEVMFAKEQEIISVSILANNLIPYQYRVFTRNPLISY